MSNVFRRNKIIIDLPGHQERRKCGQPLTLAFREQLKTKPDANRICGTNTISIDGRIPVVTRQPHWQFNYVW